MQFSKMLATYVLTFCAVAFVILSYIGIKFDTDIKYLLDYLQQCVSIILIFYFGKSATENVIKIKTSNNIDPNKDRDEGNA